MPDPQPQMIYEHLAQDRERFIGFAEDIATLVAPTMDPRGDSPEPMPRPWTPDGISGVRSLSSATMKIIMPPGVQWAQLDLPAELWQWLEAKLPELKPEQQAEVQAMKVRLRNRSNSIMRGLMQKKTRSRIASGVRRNLVEGSTAVRNLPGGLTVFPLRSHVVKRNEFGDVEILGIHEELPPDPFVAETAEDLKKTEKRWTLINYDRNEVWRQVEQNAPERVEDEDAASYFVFVPEIPDTEDYPVGYAYNYMRLIAQLDHEEASMAQAMAFAAWNPVGVREGSALAADPTRLTKRKSSEPVVMQEGDIIWPNKQHILSDWGFVAGMRATDKAEAAKIFAKGIKDLPLSPDRSATEVLEIVDEINSETADLLTSYEDTLQRPLILSESRIQDVVSPLFQGVDRSIFGAMLRVVITTGVNALDKQRTLTRLVMQFLPAVVALDPRVKPNGAFILDRMGESMLLNTEGVYSVRDDTELQMMALAAGMDARRQASGGNGNINAGERMMTRGGPQRVGGGPQPVRR